MATARRPEIPDNTQHALIASAVGLFTQYGYAGTSLDEIARQASVTKGALYHHFAGKKALFEAAFDSVEGAAVSRLTTVIQTAYDSWSAATESLRAFLTLCLEPSYQRIVIHDAPAVLGWQRWGKADARSTYGVVREALSALIEAAEIDALPLDALARLVFGALSAGATTIAASADPEKASVEVGECVERLLQGLRTSGSVRE